MGSTTKATSEAYSVRRTNKAKQEIDAITGYIAFVKVRPLNAVRVRDAFERVIDRIERNPWMFQECNEIPTKNKIYRKASCYSWNIIYKISGIDVVVLGVVHQSRNSSRIRALRRRK